MFLSPQADDKVKSTAMSPASKLTNRKLMVPMNRNSGKNRLEQGYEEVHGRSSLSLASAAAGAAPGRGLKVYPGNSGDSAVGAADAAVAKAASSAKRGWGQIKTTTRTATATAGALGAFEAFQVD